MRVVALLVDADSHSVRVVIHWGSEKCFPREWGDGPAPV